MRGPAVVVLLSVAAAGCASKSDVETLQTTVQADLEEIRVGQAQLLDQIRGGLDSLDAAGMRRETTGRGEFERRVANLEALMDELLEITGQNNQLLNDLYEARVASGSSGGGFTGPTSDPGGSMSTPTLSSDVPSQLYGLALEQYNLGNYETARGALRNFISENPSHELAPDAQFYIGRAHEEAGEIGEALAEYQRISEMYPDSNRAPAGLYRRGLLEVERGNTEIARRYFTQIEAGYPNSPEAPLARQELQKLGS
ncbi:MAG: tetratricopeptide repeat protein [Gemmatimonadetes bacterium]|nr:tetratricopeptide repeat protein [Gemmatimonadota bacterium]